jgi:hypothetical protein
MATNDTKFLTYVEDAAGVEQRQAIQKIDATVAGNGIEVGAISGTKITDGTMTAEKDAVIDADGFASAGRIVRSIAGTTPVAIVPVTPFKLFVTGVTVLCNNTNGGGTAQLANGVNPVTDAIACAVDKAVDYAASIDQAYNTVAAGGALNVIKNANADDGLIVIDYIRIP